MRNLMGAELEITAAQSGGCYVPNSMVDAATMAVAGVPRACMNCAVPHELCRTFILLGVDGLEGLQLLELLLQVVPHASGLPLTRTLRRRGSPTIA